MKPKILIIEQGFLRKDAFTFLRTQGYDVDYYLIDNNYPSQRRFYDKYINIFKRQVLNNTSHWTDLDIRDKNRHFVKQIKEHIKGMYDHIVVIRPDNFSAETLKYLSAHTHQKMTGYLWDSINDFKAQPLRRSRNLFADVFCFDKNSVEKYTELRLGYETNFYYPVQEIENLKRNVHAASRSISYVGNIADRRDKTITDILDCIDLSEFSLDIHIVKHQMDEDILEKKYPFLYLDYGISIHDYLKITLNSTIVLDIQAGWQNGFTFRIIEANYLKKKVITTNQFAKELKFYHPDNIFIYNQNTKQNLAAFMEKPFFESEKSAIEYYRIDSWLKRILHLQNTVN